MFSSIFNADKFSNSSGTGLFDELVNSLPEVDLTNEYHLKEVLRKSIVDGFMSEVESYKDTPSDILHGGRIVLSIGITNDDIESQRLANEATAQTLLESEDYDDIILSINTQSEDYKDLVRDFEFDDSISTRDAEFLVIDDSGFEVPFLVIDDDGVSEVPFLVDNDEYLKYTYERITEDHRIIEVNQYLRNLEDQDHEFVEILVEGIAESLILNPSIDAIYPDHDIVVKSGTIFSERKIIYTKIASYKYEIANS